MLKFTARLEIIGINPFVFLPAEVLEKVFQGSGKAKGFIPVTGEVNAKTFKQTLLRYKGYWRLYINMEMLPNSPKRIGEQIDVSIRFDPQERVIATDPALIKALSNSPEAKKFSIVSIRRRGKKLSGIFYLLRRLRRDAEIAIGFLLGKNRFIGRDKPLKRQDLVCKVNQEGRVQKN